MLHPSKNPMVIFHHFRGASFPGNSHPTRHNEEAANVQKDINKCTNPVEEWNWKVAFRSLLFQHLLFQYLKSHPVEGWESQQNYGTLKKTRALWISFWEKIEENPMNNVPQKLLNQSWEEQRRQNIGTCHSSTLGCIPKQRHCLAVVTGYNKITINQLAAYATYKTTCGTYCLVCAIKDKK